MKCKNCTNFKPQNKMEASKELSIKEPVKGKCNLTNKNCTSIEDCACDSDSTK